MAPATLSPLEALELINEQPGASKKTAEDLHKVAQEYEDEATRHDRIASSRVRGNRRRARLESSRRQAHEALVRAKVCRAAAELVERRGAKTVGEALEGKFKRRLRSLKLKLLREEGELTIEALLIGLGLSLILWLAIIAVVWTLIEVSR